MTNKNKINWSVRPKKRGIPKIKKNRGPNKKGDASQAISQYKIKYIKNLKPNTKYKPFLTLNQNPKPKKSITNPKKKGFENQNHIKSFTPFH